VKRILLLIFIIKFSSPGFSQLYDFPVSVLYGTKTLQNSHFNKQLNSFSNYQFKNAISFVGVLVSENIAYGPRGYAKPNIYYGQIIPQLIKLNDTVSNNLTGFQFGLTVIGFGRRMKNFAFDITPGFNTGRIKLVGEESSQKNPFFSPKIAFKPTFYVSRFFLSFIFEYEYDVSKASWKKLGSGSSEVILLDKVSQTGLSVLVNLGFRLKYKSTKDKKIAKNKKNDKKSKKKI